MIHPYSGSIPYLEVKSKQTGKARGGQYPEIHRVQLGFSSH